MSSPNFRHPVTFHRDVQSLDDISGGRFLLGVGTGGDRDSRILGGPDLSVKERVDRFQEFVDLLVRLRTEDHVTSHGTWFSSYDARTLPPLRDVPLVVAGNGPRSVRFAARRGDAWVTTGGNAETLDDWFAGLTASTRVLDEALTAAGREPGGVRPLPQPRLLAALLAGEHRAVRGADRARRRDRLHRRDHALAPARLPLRRRRGHPGRPSPPT